MFKSSDKDYQPWVKASALEFHIPVKRMALLYELASEEGFGFSPAADGKETLSTAQLCHEHATAFAAFVQHMVVDSVVPGLCTSCGASPGEVEPDASHYHCEDCDKSTVSSPLILLGLL